MQRREFITLTACFLIVPIAAAAQEGKIRRIGFLRVGQPPKSFIEGFRCGLREREALHVARVLAMSIAA